MKSLQDIQKPKFPFITRTILHRYYSSPSHPKKFRDIKILYTPNTKSIQFIHKSVLHSFHCLFSFLLHYSYYSHQKRPELNFYLILREDPLHHIILHRTIRNHRKPLLMLSCLLKLLFRLGISIPASSEPNSLLGLQVPLALILPPGPFCILNAFQPSNSRSNLKAFSLSSLSSRSALRAES